MLAEVVAGDVGILDTVSPLRQLLARDRRCSCARSRASISIAGSCTLGAGLMPRAQELPFDHLVVALGGVTDFRGIPGLPEHALPFKTLADAVRIRNHVIHVLEQASVVRDADAAAHDAHVRRRRRRLLGHRGRGGAERLRAQGRRRTTARSPRRGAHRAGAQRHASCSSASSRRAWPRYATKALRRAGDRARCWASGWSAASPQAAVLSDGRRIATRDADLDGPLLAQPGRRAARAAARAAGGSSATRTLAVKGVDGRVGARRLRADPDAQRRAVPADRAARDPPGEGARRATSSPTRPARGGARSPSTGSASWARSATTARSPSCRAACASRALPAWLMWRGIYWSKLPGASPQDARGDLVGERSRAAAASRPAEPRRRPRRRPGPLRARRGRCSAKATRATACS